MPTKVKQRKLLYSYETKEVDILTLSMERFE